MTMRSYCPLKRETEGEIEGSANRKDQSKITTIGKEN